MALYKSAVSLQIDGLVALDKSAVLLDDLSMLDYFY